MTEETLFQLALERPPAERAGYLDAACGGDPALRQRVERLLAAHDNPGSFMAGPAVQNMSGDFPATSDSEAPARGADSGTHSGASLGSRIGPYKLLQVLGEGGMGTVYLAEQEVPVRRRVALKVIKPGMDSAQVIARFEAERQALAMMDHPHIARVLDAGTTESGRPYFVMELVKGIPITKYCDQEHLTPHERLALFVPVCQAVQHAHQKGIIHRDLKPSNVLIALYDGRPVPKVIDFGVAKATSQRLTERTMFTEVGSIVGTLEYMAPEQAELNNLDIDTRADIFSLGILLYELLTGTPPFTSQQLRSAGFSEMLRLIREVEPEKPSTRLSSSQELPTIAASRRLEPKRLTQVIHGDLDWIVMKALEKDRARRYETASGLAADIERYLHDEPVLAGPPAASYHLKKFLRRNRGPVAAATLVFVALLAGVVMSAWQALRATHAQREAEAAREAEMMERKLANEQRQLAESQAELARENEKQAKINAQAARDHAENAQHKRDEAQRAKQSLGRNLYVSDLMLAQNAWEQNDVGRLQELLDRHMPQRDEDDLRGFEWHYWRRQGQVELRSLTMEGSFTTFEFGPGGALLAMNAGHDGSGDFKLQVWDASAGKRLCTWPYRRSFLNRSTFTLDGKRLACGGTSPDNLGWLKVCEAETGNELFGLEKDLGPVAAIASSPDGLRIAATLTDVSKPFIVEGSVKVWDIAGRKEVCTLPKYQYFWVSSLVYCPSSGSPARIADVAVTENPDTNQYDMEVIVWDAESGKELLRLGRGPDFLGGLTFSPDGTRLAAVYHRGPWSRAILDPRTAEGNLPNEPVLKREGHNLRAETGIRVWEVATGKELHTGRFTLDESTPHLCRPAFSPNGALLAAGSSGRTVKLWDVESGRLRRIFKGHGHAVQAVAFDRDGQTLYSVEDRTGTVKAWNTTPDDEPMVVKANRLVFSPCGTRLASIRDESPTADAAGAASEVTVWDLAGTKLCTFSEETKTSAGAAIPGLAFSPDGKALVSLSGMQGGVPVSPRELKLRDAATGKVTLPLQVAGSPNGWGHGFDGKVAFSPDGKRIVVEVPRPDNGNTPADLKLFDAESGQEISTIAIGADHVRGMVFCRDGTRLAARTWPGPVKVWEAATGKELFQVHVGDYEPFALSPDGTRFVAADGSHVHARTIATGKVLTFKGHSRRVTSLAFSPNGRRLASGTDSVGPTEAASEIKLWDTETGQELLTLKGYANDVRYLHFSPDGHRLYSAGPTGIRANELEVRVWDATPLDEAASQSAAGTLNR